MQMGVAGSLHGTAGPAAATHHSACSLRVVAGASDARLPPCRSRHFHPQRLELPAALQSGRLQPAVHAHCIKQTTA